MFALKLESNPKKGIEMFDHSLRYNDQTADKCSECRQYSSIHRLIFAKGHCNEWFQHGHVWFQRG